MTNFMTPKEFEDEMNSIARNENNDMETTHRAMDELMIGILRQHGYDAGCDIFEETEKWYS